MNGRSPSVFFRCLPATLALCLLFTLSCSDDDKVTDTPVPTSGACCLPDGLCEVLVEAECGGLLGGCREPL